MNFHKRNASGFTGIPKVKASIMAACESLTCHKKPPAQLIRAAPGAKKLGTI